jgi:hypothetical protein
MAINGLAWRELAHELNECSFDTTTYRALLASIERHPFPSMALVLEGERCVFHDFIQRAFSDDGNGNGYMLAHAYEELGQVGPASKSVFGAAMARFFLADRATTSSAYDQLLDRYIKEGERPRSDWWKSSADPGLELDLMPNRMRIVTILMPALEKIMGQYVLHESQRNATVIQIGLELYRSIHGQYPTSPAQLVPQILAELPRDPMHGGQFGYRLLENDAHNRSYLVYSFGIDGIDDLGHMPSSPEDSFVAIKDRGAPGFDYVFNPSRANLEEQSEP